MAEPGAHAFDADEYAAAFAPPSITIRGRTYTGVIVSTDEWFRIAPRVDVVDVDTPQDYMERLVRDMADLCFPRRWWQRRMSARLKELPWGAQLEALSSFTLAQVFAHRGRMLGRTPDAAMDGTSSGA